MFKWFVVDTSVVKGGAIVATQVDETEVNLEEKIRAQFREHPDMHFSVEAFNVYHRQSLRYTEQELEEALTALIRDRTLEVSVQGKVISAYLAPK